MQITYDPDANAMYIQVGQGPIARTTQPHRNVNLDLTASGDVVGVEILNAMVRDRRGSPEVLVHATGLTLDEAVKLRDEMEAQYAASEAPAEDDSATEPARRDPIVLSQDTLDYLGGAKPSLGNRNTCLYEAAADLREEGLSQDIAEGLLVVHARNSGLTDEEILATIGSAFRAEGSS